MKSEEKYYLDRMAYADQVVSELCKDAECFMPTDKDIIRVGGIVKDILQIAASNDQKAAAFLVAIGFVAFSHHKALQDLESSQNDD